MKLDTLGRWCGYTALVSGSLLLFAGLTKIAMYWIGDGLDLAFSLMLGSSRFFLVFVFIGILIACFNQMRAKWMSGLFIAVLGSQFDVAGFFPPLGSAMLLLGLIIMAATAHEGETRIRWALWVWALANAIALISTFVGLSLLLAASICMAGGARLVIGSELVRKLRTETR